MCIRDRLSTINIFSMFALLAVVAVFYGAWRRRTIHVDLMSVFRVLFPIAATCLIVLPFAGSAFTTVGSGVTYACFMLACVLMMMHCGQISRDSGINPVLIFAFYGTITYFMQMCGYLVGYASGSAAVLGVEQLSFVALVALYVMLLIALVGRKVGKLHTNRLEFLMLTPKAPQKETSAEIAVTQAVRSRDVAAPADAATGPQLADRVSKRCKRLSELYGLSSREAEVMELLVRGYSGPAIAEMLVKQIAEENGLSEKAEWKPAPRREKPFYAMTLEERVAIVQKDPSYGTLVCRCEEVTEAEIRAAIRRPVGARTIDAVKRRTRAGMGRCQGGFCSPRVLELSLIHI